MCACLKVILELNFVKLLSHLTAKILFQNPELIIYTLANAY